MHVRKKIFIKGFFVQNILMHLANKICGSKNYAMRYEIEKRTQSFNNRHGLIYCENGFLPFSLNTKKNVFVCGYFQSEKYFPSVGTEIKQLYSLSSIINEINYPGIKQILERNSVCISIKVEHNVGSSIYDVCSKSYWEQAILYIVQNVKNPLFFICSDNVEYVKNNLIDCNRYDIICQSSEYPVHVSLAIMGLCKHYIIGNTTFGWWAQYLNDNPEKIVVAPSRWMAIDMPLDIYQDNWHLIQV